MTNLPLVILFWAAVPLAIYRSKRRWKTFFFYIGSWIGVSFLLIVGHELHGRSHDPKETGRIASEIGTLVGILTCVWHSYASNKVPSQKISG